MRWLELSPGFSCNCRCVGCYSCSADSRDQMNTAEVMTWLQNARRQGAQHLWLSGGEPTLRNDFMASLRAAKLLGYQRIKVQTNGMLFAYPEFARRAAQAGMNEANLLLKSLDPSLHDDLNRTPGAHDLLTRGIEVLRSLPVRLEGDILVTSRNWQEIPDLVRHYVGKGFRHFNAWLFSLVDQGDQDLRQLVPRLADIVPAMVEARSIAKAHGATFCSLNTPHCAVPFAAWDMLFDAKGMELVVVNPGGKTFASETSAIELGVHMAVCQTCAVRSSCRGMRSDYLTVHGESEFRALTAEAVQGLDPKGSVLDL